MPLLFWVVPFIIAGGIMWFVANQTAPIGHEIPLSRAIAAIIVMGVFNGASGHWLKPMIGDWHIAVSFAADIIAVMAVLQLSFWRALLAVIIYFAVIFIAVLTIALIATSGKPSSGGKRAEATSGNLKNGKKFGLLGLRWEAAQTEPDASKRVSKGASTRPKKARIYWGCAMARISPRSIAFAGMGLFRRRGLRGKKPALPHKIFATDCS